MRPDRVGHVDHARKEERKQDFLVQLLLEPADDRHREHGARETDDQPRQAVPKSLPDSLLGRPASSPRAREVAAEPGQILVVLIEQRGDHRVRRDQAGEPPLGIDDRDARLAVLEHLPHHHLLIAALGDLGRIGVHDRGDLLVGRGRQQVARSVERRTGLSASRIATSSAQSKYLTGDRVANGPRGVCRRCDRHAAGPSARAAPRSPVSDFSRVTRRPRPAPRYPRS